MIFIPCYSPSAVGISFDVKTGELVHKFLGKADDKIFQYVYSTDPLEKSLSPLRYQIVPCGNCIGCRLDYAETWADRALVESFDKPSLFVTITYDDERLPLNSLGYSSISKEDVDDFIVSVRNKFRDCRVRYLCATEYGDEELRCHAHFIMYGVDLEEIKPHYYKLNQALHPMYTSDVLSECWKDRGFVVVEEANYYNMAYTARYILKKQKGVAAAEYEAFDLTPPSFRVSNRPGIGHDWAINHLEELYTKGYVPCSRSLKATGRITPNRYFKKLAEKECPSLLANYQTIFREKNYDTFHEKIRLSSFTLEQVTKYNDFARESFLKKNTFSRSNFS